MVADAADNATVSMGFDKTHRRPICRSAPSSALARRCRNQQSGYVGRGYGFSARDYGADRWRAGGGWRRECVAGPRFRRWTTSHVGPLLASPRRLPDGSRRGDMRRREEGAAGPSPGWIRSEPTRSPLRGDYWGTVWP